MSWRLTHTAATILFCVVALRGTANSRQGVLLRDDPDPTPLLWRDPGDMAPKDLLWGPGGPDRAPHPPFTFLKEDAGGTKPKVHVADSRGTTWSVKFDGSSSTGREVPAEIAAGRIMWAFGYLVEETYLVDSGVIEGVGPLEKAGDVIARDGRFRTARFERRAPGVERLSKRWSIDDNPFVGSKELSGLIIAVALLNNWDFRSAAGTLLCSV